MKKKSIFKQMLLPVMTVICALAAMILIIFMTVYEKDVYSGNQDISNLLAGGIQKGICSRGRSIGRLAADSASATGNIEKIIGELCKDIDKTVSDIEEVKISMAVGMKAATRCRESVMFRKGQKGYLWR